MASNNIELKIGSSFNGEGFVKLDRSLKSSAGNVRRVSGAVGNMLGAMEGLDGSVGKLSRTAGSLLGGFLSLGIWGGIIGAATSIVGWLGKICDEHKKIDKAFRPYVADWKNVEDRAKGYAKMVESWKQYAKDRDNAEKKAADAAAKAARAEAEAMDKKMQMEKEYDQYLMETAALKEKIAGMSDTHMAVTSAERQVEFANKWGGQMDRDKAQLQLDLAKKNEAEAIEQMAQKIREDSAREANKADENKKIEEKRAYEEKKKLEIETKRKEASKKVAELDKKIAAAKEEALRLEKEASRARGGKTFNEWQRGEKERDRKEEKAAKKQKKVVDLAKRERDQIEDRVFDRDGKIRKSANKKDIAKLEKLNEFINKQDPNNNPALKDAEKLEIEKKAALEKTAKDIEKIAKALKDGGVNI